MLMNDCNDFKYFVDSVSHQLRKKGSVRMMHSMSQNKSSSMRRFRIYYVSDINLPTSKWLCWKAHRLVRKSIIKELQLKEKKLREQKQQTQIISKRKLSQKDAI